VPLDVKGDSARYCRLCGETTLEPYCPRHRLPTVVERPKLVEAAAGSRVVDHGRARWVLLSSAVNEHFETDEIARALEDAQSIVFDFDRTTRVTSSGVREWMRFLKKLPAGAYYCFINCRPAAIIQFNLIDSFGGRGEVLSMYAPYSCPECGERAEVVVDLQRDRHLIEETSAPPKVCGTCRVEAELEEPPEIYFHYVASHPRPAPPSSVMSLVDASRVTSAAKGRSVALRIAQEEAGGRTLYRLSGVLHGSADFGAFACGGAEVEVDLAGITDVEPEGAERLFQFLSRLGCEVSLSNARFEVVARLLFSSSNKP
jgi:hypothetical protein